MNECRLCPRECGVDRSIKTGYCGAPEGIIAAKAYLHRWEEPCISGTAGSGCVFFSHCQLRCCFCQNYPISHDGNGFPVSVQRLADIFLSLQQQGAHNINLVSPTPYLPQIRQALLLVADRLTIPVAVNSGGYEKPESLQLLLGLASIYMPDIKMFSSEKSARYLGAADYYVRAVAALDEMLFQTGKPLLDANGIMRKGVIVRHLVMPKMYHDSIELLQRLYERYGTDSFLLSLMSQYTPCGAAAEYPEINRKITAFEYDKVSEYAARLGFKGYTQQRSSADTEYIPDFDGQGLFCDNKPE